MLYTIKRLQDVISRNKTANKDIKRFKISLIQAVCKVAIVFVFFAGCSPKEGEVNQPASYWYEQMIIAIVDGNLQKADSYFGSLQSEHLASPLIGDAMFMLAKAHMENNENLLAGYFANEYKVRFSNVNNVDYMAYLGVLSNYYAFGNYTKDQGFIDNNINDIKGFLVINKDNKYLPYVRHILTTFKLSKLELDNEIIRVYKMKDSQKGVESYQDKNKDLGVSNIEFEPSYVPWYVKMLSW